MNRGKVTEVFVLWFGGHREEAESLIREMAPDELVELCSTLDRALATSFR